MQPDRPRVVFEDPDLPHQIVIRLGAARSPDRRLVQLPEGQADRDPLPLGGCRGAGCMAGAHGSHRGASRMSATARPVRLTFPAREPGARRIMAGKLQVGHALADYHYRGRRTCGPCRESQAWGSGVR